MIRHEQYFPRYYVVSPDGIDYSMDIARAHDFANMMSRQTTSSYEVWCDEYYRRINGQDVFTPKSLICTYTDGVSVSAPDPNDAVSYAAAMDLYAVVSQALAVINANANDDTFTKSLMRAFTRLRRVGIYPEPWPGCEQNSIEQAINALETVLPKIKEHPYIPQGRKDDVQALLDAVAESYHKAS
jgi:hypothetical protein